ncbi:MAG: DUF4197 domain-containing protein [Cyclobacteriaceae bacterium]
MKFAKISSFLLSVVLISCTTQQINQTIGILGNTAGGSTAKALTSGDVTAGLREALITGINLSSGKASKQDGYLKNSLIKIPFPSELDKVKNTMNDLGMNKLVTDFETSINRGAEKAAIKAAPIFINAIKSMSIQDAWGLLKGGDNAATNFLKKSTSSQLFTAFKPIIHQSLGQVNATKHFSTIVNRYNQIPLVSDVNPDLDEYATNKAIDGLFKLVALEEAKIRENPAARTSSVLQKVFNQANWK